MHTLTILLWLTNIHSNISFHFSPLFLDIWVNLTFNVNFSSIFSLYNSYIKSFSEYFSQFFWNNHEQKLSLEKWIQEFCINYSLGFPLFHIDINFPSILIWEKIFENFFLCSPSLYLSLKFFFSISKNLFVFN